MPSVSPRQFRFMNAVRSYMENDSRTASPEVKRAARSMNINQVRDFTRKPRRGKIRG